MGIRLHPSLPLLLTLACAGDTTLVAGGPETETDCGDSADNDLDGAFDCDDTDCFESDDCAGQGPSAPGIAVEPSEPTSADDLSCAVVAEADWVGTGAISYTFAWLRDGIEAGISDDTVSSAATTRDELWTCRVTPAADGVSGEAAEAEVAIANALPTGAVAAISPETPREGVDGLLCAVATPAVDADGDAVDYAVSWEVDGVSFDDTETTSWPGDTVPATATAADETWTCQLTPADATGQGEATAASVTIASCDLDGDSHDAPECGGEDCEDTEPDVHPGATEICDNGLDDDCDGTSNDCRLTGTYSSTGADAWRLGEKSEDYAGSYILGGWDLDGDGREDWVLGGYAFDGPGTASGIVWVLDGPLSGSGSLSSAQARLLGEGSFDFAGIDVAVTDDLTGDGVVDLLVGANGTNTLGDDGGTAYLVAGPVSGDLDLGLATARIDGTTAHMRMGSAVEPIADLDGSGAVGVLVGAYGTEVDGRSAGAAFLFTGPLTVSGDENDATAVITGADDDAIGAHLSTGDVDGDGITDFLIGVDGHDGADIDAGALFVVYGPISGERSLEDADVLLLGEAMTDNAGNDTLVVGDVNADGLEDALIGARGVGISGAGARDGQAYLVLGPLTGDGLYDAHAELRGEAGGDRAGSQLGRANDADADGFDDMLVGATESDQAGENAGAAYLIYGPVTGRVELGDEGATIRGTAGDYLGSGLAGGDHDGDGDADILVGAFYEDTAGEAAGAVYLFEGAGM